MAPDLPEKLLGIDIDGAEDQQRGESDGADDEEAHRWFVVVGLGEHKLALPVDEIKTITEIPESLTRVPRSPPAIEGVTDLRGEITVVIDPRVHFPTTEERAGRERLLVFDRPTDQQSAAIWIDEVVDVEGVPERNVVDESTVADRDFSGEVLEHPLVEAIVELEHTPALEVGSAVATERGSDEPANFGTGARVGSGGSTALSSFGGASRTGIGNAMGEPFEIDAPDDEAAEAESDSTDESPAEEIVVEVIPLIDVDTLLLASGQGA
ncbi:chemotaxis protein CheW [Halosolutus gelatinilyticus]|uniref:chemotaxis protein CheW n=1 Tax=Halosolutus gelatinilyticus TaxID=2931975 RepID=UPI001FF3C7F8|nr:chemotaxis protein CheW [Halosolutus gelatinilyticus]